MTRNVLDHQTEVLIDVLQAARRASHDAGDAKRASEKAIRVAQEGQKRLEGTEKVVAHLYGENAALSERVRRLEARVPTTEAGVSGINPPLERVTGSKTDLKN